jgi:phosphatidylserine decarboxylase
MDELAHAQRFLWLQHRLPKALLTRLAGAFARWPGGAVTTFAIRRFAEHYGVNLDEAEQPELEAYGTFNAFFTRNLKAGARPWPDDPECLASPCDGALSAQGPITAGQIFQAKGIAYSAEGLLAGDAAAYENGAFSTIYLAPKDYHQIHMPLAGTLTALRYVPGDLFSVNPATAATRPGLFARNERAILEFSTPDGPFTLVLVGALIVGAMRTRWTGRVTATSSSAPWQSERFADRGDAIGAFELGSTVIVLLSEQLKRQRALTWLPRAPGAAFRLGEPLTEALSGPPSAGAS